MTALFRDISFGKGIQLNKYYLVSSQESFFFSQGLELAAGVGLGVFYLG